MAKAEKGSFRVLREFRVDDVSGYEVGQELTVTDFVQPGDLVDVTGTSKGRGFAGVMKRWDFRGFSRTHGTHEYFRHGGSIGNRSYPGKVFKGKRMAGHWGNERVSIQNLRVVEVRAEENLLLVKGSIPGLQRRAGPGPPGGQGVGHGISQDRARVAGEHIRRAGASPPAAPGGGHATEQPPRRHRVHQDPRRGPRQRPEAVAAEGVGKGPRRQRAVAHLGRRRDRVRAAAAGTIRTGFPRKPGARRFFPP